MAETAARNDPFLAFRFEIKLDNLRVGGFSECSGLQLETEVFDYPEGGLNTHLRKFPTRTKQTNLTLKRGIVGRELWDWYYALTQGQVQVRSGSIMVQDPSGKQKVIEWHFRDAFPCKWVGPDLNATQNNVAVETLELCHQGLERRQ
jgi:phage tail-like protein